VDIEDRSLIQPAIEHRQYRRVKLVTQIQLEASERSDVMVTRDVSVGGMFITARMPLPIDTEISITFRLYPEEPTITCRAKVTFSRLGLGMGVQFLGLSEPDFRSLQRFVDEVS
jgi:c-di-GMP-binding flagellar brake protein YcgR